MSVGNIRVLEIDIGKPNTSNNACDNVDVGFHWVLGVRAFLFFRDTFVILFLQARSGRGSA